MQLLSSYPLTSQFISTGKGYTSKFEMYSYRERRQYPPIFVQIRLEIPTQIRDTNTGDTNTDVENLGKQIKKMKNCFDI